MAGDERIRIIDLMDDFADSEEVDLFDESTNSKPFFTPPNSFPVEEEMKEFSEPYIVTDWPGDVKIVQLTPETRGSVVDFTALDPVVLVAGKDEPVLIKDEKLDATKIIPDSLANGAGLAALPPKILQRVIVDPKAAEEDDINVAPVFHGRLTKSLSVSDDGFIQLKDYKISFDVLGSGKLSEVRIAMHTKENKKYAVKIFSRTKLKKYSMLLRSSRNPVEEAYREAEFLQKLKHPNIITMKEFIDDPDDENIYIVLELMERPVIETPSDVPVPEDRVRKYFEDILRGVSHIHSCGVVHRDIKPENLLVSKTGSVKIVDFNFCQNIVLNEDDTEEEVLSAVAGTPAYTAPECLHPDKRYVAGRPLDLWSLGVTLFAMVTGNIPFTATLLPELFESILNDPVVFPPDLNLSDGVKDLINRLMEKDPVKRMKLPQVFEHEWMKKGAPLLTGLIRHRPEAIDVIGSSAHCNSPAR